jgi:ubiquinol-cytochrome c reductase cytochrome c1 subunit
MPHILYERQGPRELTTVVTHQHAAPGSKGPAEWERVTTTYDSLGYATSKAEKLTNYRGHASTEHKFKAIDASRTSAYDNDIADLTAFMTWMSEPVQQKRKQIGVFVLLFLGVFFVVAWRLNASYWKHVK